MCPRTEASEYLLSTGELVCLRGELGLETWED